MPPAYPVVEHLFDRLLLQAWLNRVSERAAGSAASVTAAGALECAGPRAAPGAVRPDRRRVAGTES